MNNDLMIVSRETANFILEYRDVLKWLLNSCDRDINKIADILKAVKLGYEIKEEFWKPIEGQEYYYIDGFGEVNYDFEISPNFELSQSTECLSEWGNLFKTKEEAKFESERIKVYRELSLYAKPFREDGSNFVVRWNHQEQKINIINLTKAQTSELFFKSEKVVRQAIDNVGLERVLRYYLIVKQEMIKDIIG